MKKHVPTLMNILVAVLVISQMLLSPGLASRRAASSVQSANDIHYQSVIQNSAAGLGGATQAFAGSKHYVPVFLNSGQEAGDQDREFRILHDIKLVAALRGRHLEIVQADQAFEAGGLKLICFSTPMARLILAMGIPETRSVNSLIRSRDRPGRGSLEIYLDCSPA